ncbi:MAG: FecCD family ABC transporter permease [Reyranellaceae bacterium]
MPVLLALCAVLAALSLCMGPTGFSPGVLLQALHSEESGRLILVELRLPRLLLGLLVGGTLGLAGATLQGLFRNPLAEPGVIGVSGCAALGAVIAFYTGLSSVLPLGLPLGGVAGALVAIALLLALAAHDPRISTLLLAGVALAALASALTALALNLSPNPYATVEVVFWLLGSLSDRSLEHVWLALPFIAVGAGLMLACGRGLEALTLGEDTARSLGISIAHLRRLAVVGVAFAVGAGVAVTGAIGFVGLIVPHLLRPLVGYRPAPLLLASIPGGACLTLAADIAVRLIGGEVELRLGVATALIGAPFFLYLVLNLARRPS